MALVEGLEIDLPFVPRLASALAGGMGGTHRWTCGIVNSVAVIAGVLVGRDQPTEEPAPAYMMMRRMFRDIDGRFGTALCHELIDISPDLPLEEFGRQYEEKECRTRICNDVKTYTIERFLELLPEYQANLGEE